MARCYHERIRKQQEDKDGANLCPTYTEFSESSSSTE